MRARQTETMPTGEEALGRLVDLVFAGETREAPEELPAEVLSVMPGKWLEVGYTRAEVQAWIDSGYLRQGDRSDRPARGRRSSECRGTGELLSGESLLLTPAGMVAVFRFLQRETERRQGPAEPCLEAGAKGAIHPTWDRQRRHPRLLWGNTVVKEYHHPAPGQYAVLERFERLNWQAEIADPLVEDYEQDPRERVRQTAKNLNHHQKNPLIAFGACWGGTGFCWRFLAENFQTLPRATLDR